MKNISISTHSVNGSFHSQSGYKHKSMSISSVNHIDRTENDVDKVVSKTDSNIHKDMTKYNVQLVDNALMRLRTAQNLLDDREAKRAMGSKAWTPEQEAELTKARKKVRATRRSYTRAQKNPKTDTAYVNNKRDAWTKAKDEVQRLTKLKDSNVRSRFYKAWGANVGVGGFSTLSMSAEMLASQGWQFHEYYKGQPLDPFTIKEQLDYQSKNPENKAVSNVKTAYKAMVEAINHNPARYGTLLAAAIHFDESSPHCDVLTLDIGVNLAGEPVGHVGKKDNGTNNDLLNIRHRTYMNGTNAVVGTTGFDADYVEKYQDQFAKDTRTELMRVLQLKNEDELIKKGFVRGIPKKEKKKQNHLRMQRLETLKIDTNKKIDSQLADITELKHHWQKSNSKASSTADLAILNSNRASIAQSSAMLSVIASLNASFSSSNLAYEQSLASSYAIKYSTAYSSASSATFSAASSFLSAKSSAYDSSLSSIISRAESIDDLGSVYTAGITTNSQKSAENALLSDSLVAREQELLLREKEQKITDSMVNKVLHAYYDPKGRSTKKDQQINDYSYGHKTNKYGQTGLEIVFLCVGQAIKKGMETFLNAFSELFGESETQIKNVRLRRMQNLENSNQSSSKNEKSNDEPTLD